MVTDTVSFNISDTGSKILIEFADLKNEILGNRDRDRDRDRETTDVFSLV
jgi:hypothetical protein